jgi:hypothetical protein
MCDVQKTILEVAEDALTGFQAVITVADPNWTGLTQYQTDSAALLAQIKAWQAGNPATEVVEAIDDVIADISLFPVPPEYEAAITIALDGLKSLIVLLEAHAPDTATKAAAAAVIARTAPPSTVGAQQAGSPHPKVAWVQPMKLYEGTRSWAVDWNREVGKNPKIASAKVKVPKRLGIF